MASLAFIDIVPGGDVILVCGDQSTIHLRTKIRVSSATLSKWSSVFKAMLSPRFKEGYELASTSTSVEIPLPDDNAEAMIILCQLMHKSTPAPLPPQALLRLAITADKYESSKAIVKTVDVSIQFAKYDIGGEAKAMLLCVAYFMEDAPLYAQLAEELVTKTIGELNIPETDEIPEILSQTSIFLRQRRQNVRHKLLAFIEGKIDQRLGFNCPNKSNCIYPDVRVAEMLRRLQQAGLWPVTALDSEAVSIEDLSTQMRQLDTAPCPKLTRALENVKHACYGVTADGFEVIFGEFAREADRVERHSQEVPRMCLFCAREGKLLDQKVNSCDHGPIHERKLF